MTNYIPDAAGWLLDEYDGPRFWAHVQFRGGMPFLDDPLSPLDESAGQCWAWNGMKSPEGEYNYGRFIHFEVNRAAHTLAYRDFGGKIPAGYDIDHLCRNPSCVNPKHLEPVTRRENVRRGRCVARTICKNGHAMTGDNVRNTVWGGVEKRLCVTCQTQWKRDAYERKLAAQGKTRTYKQRTD